jgi:hypothetical protein
MKVGKKKIKILLYSWVPIGTYHKNVKIWNLFIYISKSGDFGPFFFMENPLYRSKSYFSGPNFLAKFHIKKEKTLVSQL